MLLKYYFHKETDSSFEVFRCVEENENEHDQFSIALKENSTDGQDHRELNLRVFCLLALRQAPA